MAKSQEEKDQKIEELTKVNETLENYFRNTIIPQFYIDSGLILRKFTPSAVKQFNIKESDVGKHIDHIKDNIKYPKFRECIEKVVQSGRDLVKEIQTDNKMWYQMSILPYTENHKTNGAIITFVDITDKVEVLKGYEKQKLTYENIIYSISHDLKNPISNIERLIEIISTTSKEKEEDLMMYYGMLGTSAENLRKTLESITEINNPYEEREENVEIEKIIEDVKMALTDKVYETKAKIKVELNVPQLHVSKKDFRSILYNLLSNALKFHEPNKRPEINIATENDNGFVKLSVGDNGYGIPEKKKSDIFSKKVRLREDVEGTGIGLFLVKRMVDESGGRIEVESSPGTGTTFNIFFAQH